MSTTTLDIFTKFSVRTCGTCGIQYAVAEVIVEKWRETHQTFYCPNGHALHFPQENSEENLRREVAQKQRQLDELATDLRLARESRDSWERSSAAQRGVNTKLKKRIAAGICPCCKRSFQNLHQHMKGQHPDYAGKEATDNH